MKQQLESTLTQRHLVFHLGLLTCCISMVTYFLAFVSPHWLESLPQYNSHFLRIGLWEVCFDGYLHPSDYVSKAYFGCWYIYFPEFDAIKDWLNPPWYYAVQMLGIVAFLCLMISTIFMGSQLVRVMNRDSVKLLRANIVFHMLSGLCITIQLIAVGVQSHDQRWMPRPDQNRLGFAYGLAVVACVFCGFTTGFLGMRCIRPEEEQLIWQDGPAPDTAAVDKYREAGGASAGQFYPVQEPPMQHQSLQQSQHGTYGGRFDGQDDSAV